MAMAIGEGWNRAGAKYFDHLAHNDVQDLDPEAEDIPADDRGSDDESDSGDCDDFNGREHYAEVGKSKLRTLKSASLGPQYRGSKVNREQLAAGDASDDADDPFSRSFNDDDESENEYDGVQSASGVEDVDSEDTPASKDEGLELEEEMDRMDPSENGLAIEGQEDGGLGLGSHSGSGLSKELAAIHEDRQRKSVAVSTSHASKVDAEKGKAVKRQRAAFDSVLKTRMKLQKSLVAANTLVGRPAEQIQVERPNGRAAFEAAELAAFSLWSSLNDLRGDLLAKRTGKKRKRTDFSIHTATKDLWKTVQSQEDESKLDRHSILQKWHRKTHDPTMHSQLGGRLKVTAQATMIDVLEVQLSHMDRLVKRTQAPRSCAPLQSAQRIAEDEKIYDDADFYGLLLKELLEQKSADSVAVSNIDLGFQMRRENKIRRTVDTRASKGRKLRYNVHEKLQSFMAPEDRSTWGERQMEELFSSLFGQKLGLEVKGGEDRSEQDGDVAMEEAGLLMFRN